jgi:hypothetical protein
MRCIFGSLELEWIEGNHLFGLQLQIQFGREFENANLSKWVIKQFIKPLRYFASAMLNSLCLVGKKPFCLGSESELIWTEFKGTVSMPWRWIGSKGIGWTQNCLGLDPALGVTIFVLWRSAIMCQMPHIFIGWNAHEWMVVRVEEFTPVFVQVHWIFKEPQVLAL